MALFRREGSTRWWISIYRGPNKPRLRQSTGTDDYNAARIIEQNAMMLNRKTTSKQRAMAIIEAVAPEIEQGLEIGSVRAFYEGVARAEEIRISKLEWQKRLNSIGRMSVWMNEHTHVRWAGEVTSEIAWNYSLELGKTRKVRTRNNEIGHLRRAWNELIRHGKATENPWTLARGQRKREEETSGRAFTDAELGRILDEAGKAGFEWRDVCTVAVYTGLRMRDVETLTWGNIDFKGGMIRVTPSKTSKIGVRIAMPMHAEVRRVMERAAKKLSKDRTGPGAHVFPWRAGHPSNQPPHCGDVKFKTILERAKVVAGPGEKISFHCFRHTFNTWLAEDPKTPQDVRMRLSGHTQARTNEIYVHEDGQSRAAIGRLKALG